VDALGRRREGGNEVRYARRTDNNAQEIYEAFRNEGAIVEVIHEPVDLKVWADATKQKFMFVEIKNLGTAYGRKGPNDKQLADMQGHPWAMVTDVQGALGLLRVLRA
jgi:hypothetical protein